MDFTINRLFKTALTKKIWTSSTSEHSIDIMLKGNLLMTLIFLK